MGETKTSKEELQINPDISFDNDKLTCTTSLFPSKVLPLTFSITWSATA